MITSQEALSSRLIVENVQEIVKYTNQEVKLRWKDVSETTPSDAVRHYVASLLKEANMPTLLMGDFLLVRNENKVVYNDTTALEMRKKMVRIARRIFDIIRYRVSKESKWFTLEWSDLLDNGQVVPIELRSYVLEGLNKNGILAREIKGSICICADNYSLDNPFFQSKDVFLPEPQTR